jgi:hypothetical protein
MYIYKGLVVPLSFQHFLDDFYFYFFHFWNKFLKKNFGNENNIPEIPTIEVRKKC